MRLFNRKREEIGLHAAIAQRDIERVAILLREGEDPNKRNRERRAPLEIAIFRRNSAVDLDLLLAEVARIDNRIDHKEYEKLRKASAEVEEAANRSVSAIMEEIVKPEEARAKHEKAMVGMYGFVSGASGLGGLSLIAFATLQRNLYLHNVALHNIFYYKNIPTANLYAEAVLSYIIGGMVTIIGIGAAYLTAKHQKEYKELMRKIAS